MNTDVMLTPLVLKRVEKHVLNRTTTLVPYKQFDTILPKIKYCRKYSFMTYSHYIFDMIEDVIMDCCIKGKLRYVNISGDEDKLKKLKKDIPQSLKMKILHIIENRYIISKLDIYTYPVYNKLTNYKHTYVLYSANIIFLLAAVYIRLSNKHSKINAFYYISNNADITIHDLYSTIVYNEKTTNKYFKEYIKNSNIVNIINAEYSDKEHKYNDFKAELKRYDNMKLINNSRNETREKINKALTDVLYKRDFKEFVRIECKKLKRYMFNDALYRRICTKAGILKEYDDMIKKVDMCK